MKIEDAIKAARSLVNGDKLDASSVDHVAIIAALLPDAERVEWLADVCNIHGAVQLPKGCVERNFHSLRDAIDDAMRLPDDYPSIYEDEPDEVREENQ
jgi:hypothetical protein